ncbi:hypothetical protein [Hartmannibacter diazotrophicus]|uniref:hypothetical protein n=1 Tax=Hartmannibacter diazotrophicus TaxID=1482074 RepID=UPI0012FD0AA2|nr:hypothetical protein [Hartmannibacter diazotrophicus]
MSHIGSLDVFPGIRLRSHDQALLSLKDSQRMTASDFLNKFLLPELAMSLRSPIGHCQRASIHSDFSQRSPAPKTVDGFESLSNLSFFSMLSTVFS